MKKTKIILVVMCLVGCVFSFIPIFNAPNRSKPKSPATSTAAPRKQESTERTAVRYGLPVRLKIPKINVDAAIEQSGLTSDGDMQEPAKIQNVGWYKFGPHPGNNGSAVVGGHYGWSNKGTSVFNTLHTLNKGDLVYIEDDKGAIATFIVRELRTYNRDAAAPEVFGSSDEKAHLNLVTCDGVWQKSLQTYTDRLVVFTDSR